LCGPAAPSSGGVKTQPGGRTFVAVDGRMSDNPRVSLYGTKYTVALVIAVTDGHAREWG